MESIDRPSTRKGKALRWIARFLGLILVGFWLLITIVSGLEEGWGLHVESSILLVLILASALAFIIAWWHEALGGFLLLFVGIAHAIFACFAASRNNGLAMAVTSVPFLLLGALFLWSWSRSRRG